MVPAINSVFPSVTHSLAEVSLGWLDKPGTPLLLLVEKALWRNSPPDNTSVEILLTLTVLDSFHLELDHGKVANFPGTREH
ncbi:hypothetical protein EZV61_02490 [Corallincola luteus]|uniref:Uncharacterized protein n=1 Tax=Corallincola luteus TaxID=1775177 RepID=A0ABY2AR61_9GAMM|nr:hypothetical protein [Corallincola luteus]TCI04858.1 hypothetical protein EZV61_02490 [Corallincola luteus]